MAQSTKSKPDKRERFVQLASRRTQKVLVALETLANCANRSQYEYDENDVRKIMDAIDSATERVGQSFASGRVTSESEFTLES